MYTSEENNATSRLRSLVAFPGIKDFYNLLYDRIYMVLDEFYLDHPFTIFINALPRNHESGTNKIIDRYGSFELGYVGINSQKHFTDLMLNEHERDKLVESWDYLDKVILHTRGDASKYPIEVDPNQQYAQLASGLYERVRDGQLNIEELGYGNLDSYFKDNENYKLPITQCEYNILSTIFDISSYHVLSLPLIQFGEVDGVVHVVFHKEDLNILYKGQEKLKPRKAIGRIIKAISREFEGIMLDWEVEGESYDFKTKSYARVVEAEIDKDLYARLKENPILNELKYKEYYEKHRPYFEGRFKRALSIPEMLNVPYRQAATLSIIIDSFAHNITAHSLTALEWWFRQRSLQDQLEANDTNTNTNIQPKWADALLVDEIHRMIRYLQDKGAFWTGLPREQSFGGKVDNLYNIIWDGFASNALLFGTIAFSENILRVNIKVSIIETIENQENVFYKKRKIRSGHFASIDLNEFYTSVIHKQDKRLNPLVKKGADFDTLQEALKKMKAFFPGSVVGQQAFNTVLENELRNVKHYSQMEMEEMRRNGLTLHLSFEEKSINLELKSKESEYLVIGVWLEHPTVMSTKKIIDRLSKLNGDILDSQTNRALLGGTYQDKICAAYLFNGSFYSTQKQDSVLEQRFFPWIKLGTSLASSNKDEVYDELMISARRYFSETFPSSKALFESKLAVSNLGYFKKFLHLWKGADVYQVDNPDNLGKDFENPARFRFANLSKGAPADARIRLRQEGIIRVIHAENIFSLADAYRIWLTEWLYPYELCQIQFYIHDSFVALLEFKNGKTTYYNIQDRKAFNIKLLNIEDGNCLQQISFVHGADGNSQPEEKNRVRYRSHGVFKQYFLDYANLHEAEIREESLAAELLEILVTSVLIFDNRIAERMAGYNVAVLKEQLNCEAYREEISIWEREKLLGFNRFHILVLHLSFIEAFLDSKGHKVYSEDDVKKFIDDEILSNPKVREKQNFLIMITTGRGRTQWWEKLKENRHEDYTSFVTFRPVEAILSSIEDAVAIKDDIELKYRLIKVLFGS